MISLRFLLLLSFFSLPVFAQSFLPFNLWQIPPGVEQGISQQSFGQIIDEAQGLYGPIIDDLGKELVIYKAWSSNSVNAYADRSDDGRKWEIILYGGLARHPQMTEDGFRLVICHELGHHLGGAPKKIGNNWSSVEGQADFYGPLKCLKKWWEHSELTAWRTQTEVPELVEEKCLAHYQQKQQALLCMRSSLAGWSVAKVMQELEWESLVPQFETPDKTQVSATLMSHPSPQCRLDTYFQAALCHFPHQQGMDDDDPTIGLCPQNSPVGYRPRCWFNPI